MTDDSVVLFYDCPLITEELQHEDARFLVLKRRSGRTGEEGAGEAVGYVHFRFVDEEGTAVLYVYELQLDPKVHRCAHKY